MRSLELAKVHFVSGTDMKYMPVCPGKRNFEERAFGQVHFSLHLPDGQDDFLNTTHFYIENGKNTQKYANNQPNLL